MNEPMAKAINFTRTTSMPAPAADRSFARTASISEPRALRRRLRHSDRHGDEHHQHHEPELDPWEVGADLRP